MDISEINALNDNISWLRNRMPNYLANWQASRPNCNFTSGLIKEICTKPGILAPQVFDPLLVWLNDYKANREGKLAFPGPAGVDNFLKIGLRRIYNFVVVADFFSENSQFFAPSPSLTQTAAYQESRKTQKQFSEFIDILNSKLVGCNEKLTFLFLRLSKTISVLPDDLRSMQNYLENYCRSFRVKQLRR